MAFSFCSKLSLPAMLKHPEITERRIDQFITNSLENLIYRESAELAIEFCAEDHFDAAGASGGKFEEVGRGFRWGPAWRTVWFRATGEIPKGWAGKEVVAKLEVGGERMVWSGSSPVAGVDVPHSYFTVSRAAKGGEKVKLLIQAAGDNPDVRVHGRPPERQPFPFEVGEAALFTFDRELWQFYLDCKFNFQLLKTFPEDDVARAHLLRGLNEAVNRFDANRLETLVDARKALREFAGQKRPDRYHTITPVGHAHLDTAWLWPLHITHKKMAHTAATQLALMEQYPEYVFVHSQASQYEWLETEYPELFERVKQKAKEGNWEPLGSMWVEADNNLAGGESLVRQFLYGKRYFREKFGIDTKDMWLPDVFGYSAATPQILAKCGIEYFFTQKISWNQTNKFPHNTFWWQGIDGTRVWSHFPPADTYTGMCTPAELKKHITNNKDHARSDLGLYVFGFGDGGGGPTAEHIEMLRRASRSSGIPQISWRKASEFFADAKDRSRDLPTWCGELYLEVHRGTYTTQAKNKKLNRQCEFLLRDAEALCCFAPAFRSSYPAAELEALWKKVLLNQFHDILPGSSVKEVYEESSQDYAEVVACTTKIIREKLAEIAADKVPKEMRNPYAIFKFSEASSEGRMPYSGNDPPESLHFDGESLPVQAVDEFGEKSLLFQVPEAALANVAVCEFQKSPSTHSSRLVAKARRLENDTWAVRFDQNGNITSVESLEDQTEYIEQGHLANCFQLFDDRPLFWSAWDIDPFALETQQELMKSERFEIVEKGPVRVAAEIEKRFGNSVLKQRISLGPTPGIRFDTWIDWRETEKMLKVAFPVNVNSTRATYEIQFGNVERPTHCNTSWDMARFEVCAHKWVDLSEGDHGVALLNDSKYGHDIHGNVMRMTLLRSPKAPDPEADMGVHRFTYVLLPHFGPYNWASVVQAAYALNTTAHVCRLERGSGAAAGRNQPLVSCDDRNIVLEGVKKAENDDSVIVRLYEAHNGRGFAELSTVLPVKSAALCDLLENEITELETNDGMVQFEYRPFEILTLKLNLA